MSASQEKKRRREQRAEGVEKKQVQKTKTLMAKKRAKKIKTAAICAVAFILIILVVFNSSLFYTGLTAVHIGDWKYTTAEFNYFYQSAFLTTFNQYYQSLGEYAYYLLDPNKSFSKQDYNEEQTYEDYFTDQAFDRMKKIAMLNRAAVEDKFVLDEDGQAQIDMTISNAKAMANQGGLSFSSFLVQTYGKGMTESIFNKLINWEIIAANYTNTMLDNMVFTDEELDARYEESSADYNLITFHRYFVNATAKPEEGLDDAAAKAAAYTAANEIAVGRTEDVFAELVYQHVPEDQKEAYADPTATLQKNVSPSSINADYKEWLTSPERTYGETTVIETETGFHVLLFVGSNDNNYYLQNFRHILIKAEATGQATAESEAPELTAADIKTAQMKAEEVFAQWEDDPTEDYFIQLANEESDDAGSNTIGGLYENKKLGDLVPEIEDWLFDETRKVGDTDIIYVKSANYTGYHIMYYVGAGERCDRTIAKGILQTERFETWVADRDSDYKLSTTMAFWFAK
ncbi:MAG: hypothetical protein GX111_11060 [Clostridiales bacterium]|nr:hypothetical protein [Clostridiales bacterium]